MIVGVPCCFRCGEWVDRLAWLRGILAGRTCSGATVLTGGVGGLGLGTATLLGANGGLSF